MGYMQRTRILSDSDLDDNTTWRERMDLSGKVTAIEMRINCNRHAQRAANTTVYTLADCISRIELLQDATTPLLSLSGEQLDAMNFWEFGRPNPRRYRQDAASPNDLILFIMGGRDLYDREYGWDFDRLSKVYLEYTYDLNEGDAEYFEANDHDIKLYAWQWKGDNVPNFRGYMRSKQLNKWTCVSGAETKIEIPATYPIRRVCVQALTRARTIGATFSKLELQVDKGAYSPVIVNSCMDWVMAEVQEYGLQNEIGGLEYLNANTDMDLPRWWSYLDTANAWHYGLATAVPRAYLGIQLPVRLIGNSSTAGEALFSVRGWGFQKCLRIGFDHEYDGFDLLRVPPGKSLDLICTEAGSTRDAAVFVQDVIPY